MNFGSKDQPGNPGLYGKFVFWTVHAAIHFFSPSR